MPKTTLKSIPAAALYFDAQAEIGSNGENAKTAPVTILARSGKPITHWWWGAIVHDFAGMRSKDRIALDYCHDAGEVVGYANRFETNTGDLVIGGALTPFDEKDRASEILYKAKAGEGGKGVPWQASIYFGEDSTYEEIPAGVSVTVNGNECQGPLTVVRSWELRGCAICPYGADPNTSSQFKANDKTTVNVTMLSADPEATAGETEPATSEETKPDEEKSETTETTEQSADESTANEESASADEGTETPAAEGGEETPPVENGQAAEGAGNPNQQSVDARAELRRFMTAFGANGATWFAEGLSFEDAQKKHVDALSAQVTELTTKNQELTTRLAATRGEPAPLGFSAEGGAGQQRAAELITKFGDTGLARIAAGIASMHKD